MNGLRNLAVILLAAEGFVVLLLPLALFGGLVYGSRQLLKHENLPSWLKVTRWYVELGHSYVELAMRTVVAPFLMIHSVLAKAQAWFGAARRGGE